MIRKASIPTTAVISQDYQRLVRMLSVFGLKERGVQGDGNCQFRALADQMYGDEAHHATVRKRVCLHLQANSEDYDGFVPVHLSCLLLSRYVWPVCRGTSTRIW